MKLKFYVTISISTSKGTINLKQFCIVIQLNNFIYVIFEIV